MVRLLFGLLVAGGAAAQEEVRLQVVGPTGLPLPDVGVGFATAEEAFTKSDEQGCFIFRGSPGDRLRIIDRHFAPSIIQVCASGYARVTPHVLTVGGSQVQLRAAVGIDARVLFVDAETGTPVVAARWADCDLGRMDDGTADPLRGRSAIVLGRPGYAGGIRILAPAGHTYWERSHGTLPLGGMSYFAKSVQAIVPLRRAVTVELVVRNHRGGVPAGESRVWIEAGGHEYEQEVIANRMGRVKFDVPFFREGRVTADVYFESEDGVAVGSWTRKLGWLHVPNLNGSVTLDAPGPDPGRPPRGSSIGIGGGEELPAPKLTGRLLVRARRFDGRPAAGIPITIHHVSGPETASGHFTPRRTHKAVLDETGEARFDAIAIGEWAVDLVVAGFLGEQPRVEVGVKGVAELDFQEPRGGRLDVTVVDAKGRPLPFAELEIQRPGYENGLVVSAEIDPEGRHRVDLFTDAKGARTLYHLPPGELDVRARYGARKRAIKATLVSGETAKVTIDLPDEP